MGRTDHRTPAHLDDDLMAQFARMGATVEGTQGPKGPEAFEIMAPNVGTFRCWLALENQWRISVGQTRILTTGLDLTAADTVIRRLQPENPDEVFRDLLLMEAEAISAFREIDR